MLPSLRLGTLRRSIGFDLMTYALERKVSDSEKSSDIVYQLHAQRLRRKDNLRKQWFTLPHICPQTIYLCTH